MGKQDFDRRRPVVLRRSQQRGLAVEVRGVDIGSSLDKHLLQVGVDSFGGQHQCRVAVAVAHIDIGSLVKLGHRRRDVPPRRSREQIMALLGIIPAQENPPRRQKTPLFESAGNIRAGR